jgi:hypothetical protein
MKVVWENFNSETILVTDDFKLCVLVKGTTQPPYSWNRKIWHLNRGSCGYICDPISLLAFSVCQWPGMAGLHHLPLCATVDILRYSGCGPASPVYEATPKTYSKYNDSVACPLLKFLHKEDGSHTGWQRMRGHSSHLFLET